MTYSGLFLRHFMGDRPGGPQSGPMSNSPDIILVGKTPEEPAKLITKESYEAEPPDTLFTGPGNPNYVYVRALNATQGTIASRLWLWYAEPNMLLWPQEWKSTPIYVNSAAQNWVNVSASSPNQILVGDAFEIISPQTPQDHYCMVAMVEQPPLSEPASPPFPGAFSSLGEFAAWIQSSPNAAWRNTVDVAVQGGTWSWVSPLKGPLVAEEVIVGAQCLNMPVGTEYEWNIPAGTTKSGQQWPALNSGRITITKPNQGNTLAVKWPAEVVAGITITWWANGQKWETGATIVPTVGAQLSALEGLVEDPMKGAHKTMLMSEPGNVESARAIYYHPVGGVPLRMC